MDATDSDKHSDHNTRLTYVYKEFYNTGPKLPRLFNDKTQSLNLLNGASRMRYVPTLLTNT